MKLKALLGLIFGLFLTVFFVSLQAQDRDQIQNLASNLSRKADKAWSAMQNAQNSMKLSDHPSARQLYGSLRNFDRRARQFKQNSDEPEELATLRMEAQRLVHDASRIQSLMFEANMPDPVLREWSEADNSVENLANVYGFPYQREHALARRNYNKHEAR
jgi:hypothetical protein